MPCRMGKVPIRLKEVVYTISPFETTVMSGLFQDVPKKLAEKIKHVRHSLAANCNQVESLQLTSLIGIGHMIGLSQMVDTGQALLQRLQLLCLPTNKGASQA